jgi:hypothetical protein
MQDVENGGQPNYNKWLEVHLIAAETREKETAVAFQKWIEQNHYMCDTIGLYFDYELAARGDLDAESEYYTIEHLYKKFKEENQ